MYGAEFICILRDEGLTVEEAIEIMKDAQEFGETFFMSKKPQRKSSYRYSYDVEARLDFDGSWLFDYRTSQ